MCATKAELDNGLLSPAVTQGPRGAAPTRPRARKGRACVRAAESPPNKEDRDRDEPGDADVPRPPPGGSQLVSQIPHELSPAHDFLLPLILTFKSSFGRPISSGRVELSVSFGSLVTGLATRTFENHTSGVFFRNTLKMMEKYVDWESTATTYAHDYFYSVDALAVQTSTYFRPPHMSVEHSSTVTNSNMVLAIHEAPTPGLHVCVSMKTKQQVAVDVLPPIVLPLAVRLRKQSSFTRGTWKFVFEQEWVAATRTEAEDKQLRALDAGSMYNIKIVYIGSERDAADAAAEYLSLSLLLKICSVMGGGNIFYLHPVSKNF